MSAGRATAGRELARGAGDVTVGIVLFGRYRVISQIGRGGSAVVWRARDLALERDVAVKILRPDLVADPGSRARFLAEARTAAALSHPSIVAVHDVRIDDDVAALVMEHVDGEPLSDRIAREGALPAGAAAWIAGQIADALCHAHARGVVHRDVKPGNILLGVDGRARLADFGIARMVLDDRRRPHRASPADTAGGADHAGRPDHPVALGTLRYMAPEQLAGAPAGPASDVFSLGAVLHELLTGAPPFPARDPAELAHAHAAGPCGLGLIPAAFRPLVAACLEMDPRRRPRAAAVARWARATVAASARPAGRSRRGPTGWRLAAGALLVAGLVACSAAVATAAENLAGGTATHAAAAAHDSRSTVPASLPRPAGGTSGSSVQVPALPAGPAGPAAPRPSASRPPAVPAVDRSAPRPPHGGTPGDRRRGGHGGRGQQAQEASDG